MCILFICNGNNVEESDYSLILVSNRDEYYDRAAQNMAPWVDDPDTIAGRDLEAESKDSTWLALSPLRRKLGVLLNLPGKSKENAKSRGRVAANYAKTNKCTTDYIDDLKQYADDCNEFLFVTAEFMKGICSVSSYNNATGDLSTYTDTYLGFGNSLPDSPLKKVDAGRSKMIDICQQYNKISTENVLIDKLLELLKWEEKHLPDHELEVRRPKMYKELSSLFVTVPEMRYGTRTHTIVLVTKNGHMTVIEMTMRAPVDVANPQWDRTELQFDIDMDN